MDKDIKVLVGVARDQLTAAGACLGDKEQQPSTRIDRALKSLQRTQELLQLVRKWDMHADDEDDEDEDDEE